MKQLLVIREHLLNFYQNNAQIIRLLCRFVIAIAAFAVINQLVGYQPGLRSWYVVVLLSLISAALPPAALLLLVAAYTVLHVYYVSIVLAMALALTLAVIYFVYIRFAPLHGYVILAVPILSMLRIPYVLPLVMGVLSTPVSIIPMTCGVLFYYILESIKTVVGTATEDSLVLYNQAVQLILPNQEMYLTIGIFAVVIITVYLIHNMEFDYAVEMSVLAGAVLNLILFLITNVLFDMHYSMLLLIVQTVICVFLAEGTRFFKLVLNYSAVEYLQFEDDEYYYYVKAVPKVSIPAAEVKVKRFNAHLFGDGWRTGRTEETGSPEEEKEEE